MSEGSRKEDEIKTRAGGFGYASQQKSNVRRLSLLMWATFDFYFILFLEWDPPGDLTAVIGGPLWSGSF